MFAFEIVPEEPYVGSYNDVAYGRAQEEAEQNARTVSPIDATQTPVCEEKEIQNALFVPRGHNMKFKWQ